MRKLTVLLILALVLVAAIFIAANDWPARLRVINNSGDFIVLNLGVPYQYLYVGDGDDVTFTLPKDDYDATVWYCGEYIGKSMDLNHNLKLNFTGCKGTMNRIGERTQEKVDLEKGPKRDFHFQY